MAATVQWENSTAASATWSAVTQVRFKNANDANIDLNNPMVKPGVGFDYSFEKAMRLNCTIAPSNQITNVRFFVNGTQTTGLNTFHKFTASYTQPVELDGTSIAAYVDSADNTYYVLTAGPFTGTGQIGNLIYLGMTVGTTASSGLQNMTSSGNYQA